jgi:hypothetical protein
MSQSLFLRKGGALCHKVISMDGVCCILLHLGVVFVGGASAVIKKPVMQKTFSSRGKMPALSSMMDKFLIAVDDLREPSLSSVHRPVILQYPVAASRLDQACAQSAAAGRAAASPPAFAHANIPPCSSERSPQPNQNSAQASNRKSSDNQRHIRISSIEKKAKLIWHWQPYDTCRGVRPRPFEDLFGTLPALKLRCGRIFLLCWCASASLRTVLDLSDAVRACMGLEPARSRVSFNSFLSILIGYVWK